VSRIVDRRRLRRLLAALACAAPLLGCTHQYVDRRDSVSFAAGDAMAANRVAQMVDPWPAEAANRNIPHNGQRMQRAVERYRTNRTTPLSTTGTSSTPYVPVLAPASPGGGGPSQ
jgi:hypothetical protein